MTIPPRDKIPGYGAGVPGEAVSGTAPRADPLPKTLPEIPILGFPAHFQGQFFRVSSSALVPHGRRLAKPLESSGKIPGNAESTGVHGSQVVLGHHVSPVRRPAIKIQRPGQVPGFSVERPESQPVEGLGVFPRGGHLVPTLRFGPVFRRCPLTVPVGPQRKRSLSISLGRRFFQPTEPFLFKRRGRRGPGAPLGILQQENAQAPLGFRLASPGLPEEPSQCQRPIFR